MATRYNYFYLENFNEERNESHVLWYTICAEFHFNGRLRQSANQHPPEVNLSQKGEQK